MKNSLLLFLLAPIALHAAQPQISGHKDDEWAEVTLTDMNQPMLKQKQAMQSTLIIHMPDTDACVGVLKSFLPWDRVANLKFITDLAQKIGGKDVQEGKLIYDIFDLISDFNDGALNSDGASAIKGYDTKIYQLVAHFRSLSLQQDAQLTMAMQQQHVEEVKQSMTDNIDKVLARGKEFEELWESATHLG